MGEERLKERGRPARGGNLIFLHFLVCNVPSETKHSCINRSVLIARQRRLENRKILPETEEHTPSVGGFLESSSGVSESQTPCKGKCGQAACRLHTNRSGPLLLVVHASSCEQWGH